MCALPAIFANVTLASSLDPKNTVPAFSRLNHLHTFKISCHWGTKDVSPVSECLIITLAASLPTLTHLSMFCITCSAIHVDPCDVPFNVPIVTNDFNVPLHPTLASDLALPSLLRLPSLCTLELLCDTWLPCPDNVLGLPIGQHISVSAKRNGNEITCSYTTMTWLL
ncbi:hypothetical protein JVT61DRAFT_6245 [Boletus reticuloceps]|uniref:Flavoprotein pyridine nucleotide cytochrome reductase-like FAD-binding domain-containing protein n=1 Tax=Boletus reticuloceps TaxID=495285 RepID=A0A8I3A8L7_9AGAM|nr:hypothetical protein JVT61DRAFT_6245 [Boletus reticuloceps]